MTISDLPDAPEPPPNPLKPVFSIILWVLIPLAIGLWLAAQYVSPPAVGLVRLETDIWAGSAEFFKQQLERARTDDRIRAVVVVIDSPGGEVAPTQDMFYEVLSLREEMPVVASINSMAASGGFYLAMAADPIYAKPNSTVGNVGVWGFAPEPIGVNEQVLASGPFKLTASNSEEFLREIETIKQEFLQTVQISRGDRLSITLTDLSQGLAYPGRLALGFGLIDQLGSQNDAVKKAAELAGIENYEVIDLESVLLDELYGDASVSIRPGSLPPTLQAGAPETAFRPDPWYLAPWPGSEDPLTGNRALTPGLYLLYDVRIGGSR